MAQHSRQELATICRSSNARRSVARRFAPYEVDPAAAILKVFRAHLVSARAHHDAPKQVWSKRCFVLPSRLGGILFLTGAQLALGSCESCLPQATATEVLATVDINSCRS
jgi:hypothetical protein